MKFFPFEKCFSDSGFSLRTIFSVICHGTKYNLNCTKFTMSGQHMFSFLISICYLGDVSSYNVIYIGMEGIFSVFGQANCAKEKLYLFFSPKKNCIK